jgi:cold shock protein
LLKEEKQKKAKISNLGGGIKMKGRVKFFNEMKGFGFIEADDGKEYFVHQSGVQEGVALKDNDPVEFDVEEGDRGPKAVNVRKEE